MGTEGKTLGESLLWLMQALLQGITGGNPCTLKTRTKSPSAAAPTTNIKIPLKKVARN